ncbi:hypothetical protein [Microlunatus speluncae]|uniref:hypothetical protein n=1 Tax=Microlunatus speluncae TaxID=2594267 RepID=UPI0012667F97|nr:hypothetical protein [Microlunatus speluncae]
MARTKTTVAAAVVGGALALGAITVGATVAAADPTQTPSATPSAGTPSAGTPSGAPDAPRPEGREHRHGGPGLLSAAKLAEKLGLPEDRVSEALQAVKDELRADREKKNQDERPSRTEAQTELARLLAEKLGIEQSAVEKAFSELRAEGQAEALTSLKERLAEAVQAGTLTQAEADAVVKAAEAGVIPTGPR